MGGQLVPLKPNEFEHLKREVNNTGSKRMSEQDKYNVEEDASICNGLHIAGNYWLDSQEGDDCLVVGLELLKKTIARIKSFRSLSEDTQRELVVQKRRYGLPLSAEEQKFAQKHILI